MMAFLSLFFVLTGSAFCLIAAIGILRFPDFFLRMHAATKAGVAGAGLVLIGVGFTEPSFVMWIKVVFGIGFLLLTQPIAGHLLARAGYISGVPLWDGTSENQLEGKFQRGQFYKANPED
jgi:monovalent cation/proton antiporter MnhG/PhaG subunit